MKSCIFVSDLHGHLDRFSKLFDSILTIQPDAVFIGGDILPSGLLKSGAAFENSFIDGYLVPEFRNLKSRMRDQYPKVFIILGNDDDRSTEQEMIGASEEGIWHYIHNKKMDWDGYSIFGYSYVPPTPFLLKDWERYDVSRHIDPGCISPEEGHRTLLVSEHETKYSTIKRDLENLTGNEYLKKSIFLFHSPPYDTGLDRAALDGKSIDHAPLDVHVGSIAIRRFIESRQPLLTLHGHVHESAKLTGKWHEIMGVTHAYSAAHYGPELALIKFDLENLAGAQRDLV